MKLPFKWNPVLSLALGLMALGGCDRAKTARVKEQVKETVQAATGTVKPAEPNTFDAVTGHLDKGGAFFLYLSTEQWLATLSQQLNSFRDLILSGPMGQQQTAVDRDKAMRVFNSLAGFVKKSGIEEVTGVGASSFAIEPGIYRNTFFMHHHPGRANGFIWSGFGKAPHPLTQLDFLPPDTALAGFSDVDLPRLIMAVRNGIDATGIPEAKAGLEQGLAQLALATGMSVDDLLKSLGDSVGMVLTLDRTKTITLPMAGTTETIAKPRLALFLQVKDDRLFQQLDRLMGVIPMIVKVDEPDLRMRSMPMPVLPQLEMKITAALWNRYLVLTSDDQLIRDMMAAQKDGRGWKTDPEFAKLSAGMPEQGNSFQIVTQRFVETWMRLQKDLMKNQPGTTPEQSALMEKLLAYQHPGPAFSVSAQIEDGWLTVNKGSQGAAQFIAPLVIAPVAVAAGMAVPVFSKVQERGKATKSLSNAKQIGLACKLYATDHGGNLPPSLDVLVPDYLADKSILVSPFAPNVPVGYTYTAGLSDTGPSDTVLLEDSFSNREKFRVILHADLSGEVLPMKSN